MTESFSMEVKWPLQTDHYAGPMQNRCRTDAVWCTFAHRRHNLKIFFLVGVYLAPPQQSNGTLRCLYLIGELICMLQSDFVLDHLDVQVYDICHFSLTLHPNVSSARSRNIST